MVAVGPSENLGMGCCVLHIITPRVDVIWPVALFCTISSGSAAVEVPPPILLLFFYWVHFSLLTWRSLQGSEKGKNRHSWSGNQSSSNWTLLLKQSVCIATSSDGLPYCCWTYSAQSTRLHLGLCCTWHWGLDPSHSGMLLVLLSGHSGMLLVLLSGQSRWPQVQQ